MGYQKYLASNDTSTSFDIVRGWQAVPSAAQHAIIENVMVGTRRLYRGLSAVFFGAGSENQTFNYRLWIGYRGVDNGLVNLTLFATGTATLGTATGGAAQPATSSDLLVDTITAVIATAATTDRGAGGAIEAAYGSDGIQAFSPANNEEGFVYAPDMGEWDIAIFDYDMTGATSGNCAYARTY